MTGIPIVHSFLPWRKRQLRRDCLPPQRDLHTHWRDQALVSRWAALSPPAFRLLDLLGPLHWAEFPERDLIRNWGQPTLPYAALAAAWLIQLNEGLVSMSLLRRYLVEHPLLIWLLGFPLAGALHALMAFSESQIVRSPRRRKPSSYARQLRTR